MQWCGRTFFNFRHTYTQNIHINCRCWHMSCRVKAFTLSFEIMKDRKNRMLKAHRSYYPVTCDIISPFSVHMMWWCALYLHHQCAVIRSELMSNRTTYPLIGRAHSQRFHCHMYTLSTVSTMHIVRYACSIYVNNICASVNKKNGNKVLHGLLFFWCCCSCHYCVAVVLIIIGYRVIIIRSISALNRT